MLLRSPGDLADADVLILQGYHSTGLCSFLSGFPLIGQKKDKMDSNTDLGLGIYLAGQGKTKNNNYDYYYYYIEHII